MFYIFEQLSHNYQARICSIIFIINHNIIHLPYRHEIWRRNCVRAKLTLASILLCKGKSFFAVVQKTGSIIVFFEELFWNIGKVE